MTNLTVALAGNPNAGKSTLFNALTGLHQHVGNWPGKTVERREGRCRTGKNDLTIVDLPGAYSLNAHSPEEEVARDALVDTPPDAVINVVDATNLERNLYYTVQLLEMERPVVVALNMADSLRKEGVKVDVAQLSSLLGNAPVLPISAARNEGIDTLLANTTRVSGNFRLDYGADMEAALATVAAQLPAQTGLPARWAALKLLEGDVEIRARVAALPDSREALETAAAQSAHLRDVYGDDVEMLVADKRYGFINGVVRQAVHKPALDRITLTQRVDDIVTHRWLGLPIFFLVMYVVFQLVINVAQPFLGWADAVINGPVANWIRVVLLALGAPLWLQSLAVNGIVAGVGSVLVFVPGLLILYFFLALLEDSGYMARAAFVMDRFMRVIGLHGKSFIPMILGFGCAVPAIYATRTIAGRRDRILTGLLVPLMSCSARLPVYVVFGMALFQGQAGLVIWALYALGILVAIMAGLVFTRTLLQPDTASAFVLELPPYRRPALKGLMLHTSERTGDFIRNAGTMILSLSVVIWLLLNLPMGVQNQRDSYFGRVSATVAPIFAPLGFGTWQATGALVMGLAAKEVVVATLGTVYAGDSTAITGEPLPPVDLRADVKAIGSGFVAATGDAARTLLSLIPGVNLVSAEEEPADTRLSAELREAFTPLSAFAFLVFVLLYVPCVATLAAIRHEYGARWSVTAAVYQTATAWLLAMLIYQIGSLFLA